MALVKAHHPVLEADPVSGDAETVHKQWVADLASADVSVRRQAARGLSALSAALPIICGHLAHEINLSVRSIILTGLIQNKSPAVVEALLPLLASDDANLRCGAVEALQEMPDQLEPHIPLLLADPDSLVRIATVTILSNSTHPMVPHWLHQVVASDPHVNVCAAALDALAEVGDPVVLPSLDALAERFAGVSFIQFAVDTARRRIRGR